MKLKLKQNFRGRRAGEEFNWPDDLAKSLIDKDIAEAVQERKATSKTGPKSKKKNENTERAVKDSYETR
jgi:hypothetical protein